MVTAPTGRTARPEDLDVVVEALRQARAESPLGSQLCSPDAPTLQQQMRSWSTLPDTGLLVAEVGEELAGIALVQHVNPGLFSDVRLLQIEALFVAPQHRRRGVGRVLMHLAASAAAENEADHVITIPLTGTRSEQRFLSGLGFQPAGTRRVADTATLLRRLEQRSSAPRRGSRGIEEIIARRRRSRGLPPTPARGLPLSGRGNASHVSN